MDPDQFFYEQLDNAREQGGLAERERISKAVEALRERTSDLVDIDSVLDIIDA